MIQLFQVLSRTLLCTVVECIASLGSHCRWSSRKVSDSTGWVFVFGHVVIAGLFPEFLMT